LELERGLAMRRVPSRRYKSQQGAKSSANRPANMEPAAVSPTCEGPGGKSQGTITLRKARPSGVGI